MSNYGSRKFIVTMSVLVATVALGAYSKVDANVALVFGACVAAYNWANLRQSQQPEGRE